MPTKLADGLGLRDVPFGSLIAMLFLPISAKMRPSKLVPPLQSHDWIRLTCFLDLKDCNTTNAGLMFCLEM